MTTKLGTTIYRVLDEHPCRRLDAYIAAGGGRGLAAAQAMGHVGTIDVVAASGLRGRGGAGFPTGVKWRTVATAEAIAAPTAVVVNGAEGEPGTFKDRQLLRQNPFKVLEGALIAAVAVEASEVVVALKESFDHEQRIVAEAIRPGRRCRMGRRHRSCASSSDQAPTCSARRRRSSRSSRAANRSPV